MTRIGEDGHTDKPSAIRKLKVSIENAQAILDKLESHDGELMTWWVDKITLANDYLSKAKDFIANPVKENYEADRDGYKRYFKDNKYFRKDLIKVEKYSKGAPTFMKRGEIGMATQMLRDIKFQVDNILEEIADEFDMPELVDESIKETTYKLRRGSTASDLDELDAELSRMKILGKPDFSKLTYTIDKSKLSSQKARHLDRLMKQNKTIKIDEGFASDAQRRAAFASGYKAKGKKKKKEAATPKSNPDYYRGLSKKDKDERERVIKRRAKMDSDDPKAYRPFRSDKGVKSTKKSQYTTKFKKMFGELSEDQRQVFKEKLSAKIRKSLKKKAKKANAPMGALTTIYNKGLAAWRTGHRPGANQHAWAMARVNSVLTGGKARKVDAAQWKQISKHRKKKK